MSGSDLDDEVKPTAGADSPGESCGCSCCGTPGSSALPCSDVGAGDATAAHGPPMARADLLRRGLRLEYLTVAWNIVEGIVSVAAAHAAGSVALLGFGIDSFVETASGLVLIWRLRAERHALDPEEIERLDKRAHKLVGFSLFLLALYVAIEATRTLITQERPQPTMVGIAITSLSLAVMWWLARAKYRTARHLESRALAADSFQTTACFWLSLVTLAGIGVNAALGWWWADPIAALGMTWFLVAEGREAWRGQECGCSGRGGSVQRC